MRRGNAGGGNGPFDSLRSLRAGSNGNGARPHSRPEPIAIIGMRGRFPGASDLDTYWRNLADGVESIEVLSEDDMRAAGIPDHISRLPGYVNASPVLDRIDEFDAEFFGFSARDASLTDPQHRLFLETCWEALEDAGYDPARFPGAIGLFGGCELSSYLYQLYQNRDSLQFLDGMTLMVTNDKDHLCTQASYRLDLRGPSVVVQTTCSTSLVAVSLACESLQSGRCDMALAGGVTVRVPQRGGYFYTAGSILSPDGHCRPFDANAQGTIVGSGVGLVVLKRLSDAVRDGDNDSRARPRRRLEQRRQRQGGLHRTQLPRPGRRHPRRARHRRRHAGVDWLRRGARHGHDPRRPDRVLRAQRGVHVGHRPARLSAASDR